MVPFDSLFRFAAGCGGTPIFPGGPGLYDGLTCTGGNITITSVSDVVVIIGNVLRIAISLAGGLAVVIIIVAAIYYITSAGDPGRIKRAKDILVNVTTGLVIIVIAYAVITYIAGKF